ncbi:kinase-like protein [Gloeophyllum trabeum ATCC 11539]|uniref:Kinase-like protein n=1 Tax=Gloeophyllum trabeum (strain ATCC 11539 / FP-39264 / Madison 617) TaxID=670483 RepID=S7Q9E5_GLOTA|nr:kinase-like protein [Gloeophyllum trabeum ATCC 11539]EPQ56142.1 kinase-like protein [Gloeophyllum trabeum ATCC 11539]
MMLVSSQTTIPVPRLRKYVLHESELWIFMEYIEGRTLEEAWDTLGITMKLWVAWTLRGYIRQLRLIPIPTPRVPGPTDGSGKPLRCKGHFFPEIGAGPFASYADLSAWYTRRADRAVRLDYEWSKYRGKTPSLSHSSLHFDDSEPLVLTHGDISLRNIILGKDGRLWLIDWGWAGVYPQWLEYGSMMMYTERSGLKPRLWFWLVPFMAGWYRSQYRFLRALDHALTFYD